MNESGPRLYAFFFTKKKQQQRYLVSHSATSSRSNIFFFFKSLSYNLNLLTLEPWPTMATTRLTNVTTQLIVTVGQQCFYVSTIFSPYHITVSPRPGHTHVKQTCSIFNGGGKAGGRVVKKTKRAVSCCRRNRTYVPRILVQDVRESEGNRLSQQIWSDI